MMRSVTLSTGRVAWIAIAPVKSMALVQLEKAVLELTGIAGDRAFAMLDAQDRLVNGKRIGASYDPAGLRPWHGPAGFAVPGRTDGGRRGRARRAHRRLVLRPPAGGAAGPRAVVGGVGDVVGPAAPPRRARRYGRGLDRGPSATLLSTAALETVAHAGGESEPLDGRRFRMTFGIDGVEAFAEDGWIGRDVRVGAALVGRPAT